MAPEIRVISIATAIRWVGWGMAEPLIPVFLYTLLNSYGTSGLFSSVGELVFLLILPIAGILADRIPLKTFLIIGILFFFLDGLWVVAAITGLVFFAFAANVFDGFAVASDVVGRATYIRRYTPAKKIASTMGYQNTLIYFGTIVGACISLVLIRFVGYSWIFFGILPTNAITLFAFLYMLPKDSAPAANANRITYWSVWEDVVQWRKELHFLAGLTLVFYALTALTTLLIPIYAYIHGATLQEVIVLGIIAVLPELLSSQLGRVADAWRERLLPVGLLLIAGLIASLAFVSTYWLLLPTILIAQVILVLFALVIENLVTAWTDPLRYGRVSAVFEGLKDAGKFVGAVVFGFSLDYFGSHLVFLLLALLLAIVACVRFPTREASHV